MSQVKQEKLSRFNFCLVHISCTHIVVVLNSILDFILNSTQRTHVIWILVYLIANFSIKIVFYIASVAFYSSFKELSIHTFR